MYFYYFLNAAFQLMTNHTASVLTRQYWQTYVSQTCNIQLHFTPWLSCQNFTGFLQRTFPPQKQINSF